MTPTFTPIIHLNDPNTAASSACNTYVRIVRTRRTSDTKLVTCGNCKRTWQFKNLVK